METCVELSSYQIAYIELALEKMLKENQTSNPNFSVDGERALKNLIDIFENATQCVVVIKE